MSERHELFAMDTAFRHSLGVYPFETRCEMLADLGYDGTYLTLFDEADWDDLPSLPRVEDRYGLDVAGVWTTIDVDAPEGDPENERVVDLVETLDGCSNLEVALRARDADWDRSEPDGDDAARRWLERLLDSAAERGITVSLYPHAGFWMERIDDAVRLCESVDRPNLGIVFAGFHWYAVSGTGLRETLAAAGPHLSSVNLCGCRKDRESGDLPATIEPLDGGELDNFVVLSALREVDYDGPVGVQGYSVGGDVYAKLRRSRDAFRDMERRLREHPDWGSLRR
jgi:sugar phosphate isomerase/epimerase